jgi:hypothetical protein
MTDTKKEPRRVLIRNRDQGIYEVGEHVPFNLVDYWHFRTWSERIGLILIALIVLGMGGALMSVWLQLPR